MTPEFKKKAIKPTKTVGQRLKAARLEKKMTLETVEQQTNIKLKYLKAIEQDRHDILPTEVYTLGFIRCYGEVVGLNPKRLIDQYHLEHEAFTTAKGQTTAVLAPSTTLKRSTVIVTPRMLFLLGTATLVLALVLYIASGVRTFLAPPSLVIEKPRVESRITSSQLDVVGKTDPAVSLTINGELINVEPSGKFKQQLAVIPGLNTLEFTAVNRVGKETKQTIKVLAEYEIATPEPSPLPSPSPSPTSSPVPSPSNN